MGPGGTAGGPEAPRPWPEEVTLRLPPWVRETLPDDGRRFATVEERMEVAVALARRNVEEGTGGPFAACVFDPATGALVAPGVNLVVPAACSVAHAELVALALAQRTLGSHDLGSDGRERELVATAEPCAMCYGAVPWSGVGRLVCGARSEDVRALGFDEGTKPEGWRDALERRGVEVIRDVGREEARRVLRLYGEKGGPVY